MGDYNEFLKTYFDQIIYFTGSRAAQLESWSNADGERFFVFHLVCIFEDWGVIEENRSNFKTLTDFQFNNIQKLIDMLKIIAGTIDYPTNPSEYRALIYHPEWQKVQCYAEHLYNTIGKNLKSNLRVLPPKSRN